MREARRARFKAMQEEMRQQLANARRDFEEDLAHDRELATIQVEHDAEMYVFVKLIFDFCMCWWFFEVQN